MTAPFGDSSECVTTFQKCFSDFCIAVVIAKLQRYCKCSSLLPGTQSLISWVGQASWIVLKIPDVGRISKDLMVLSYEPQFFCPLLGGRGKCCITSGSI